MYLDILYYVIFIKENAYIFYILLGISGFIGGIAFYLFILGSFTLFLRLYFISDDD